MLFGEESGVYAAKTGEEGREREEGKERERKVELTFCFCSLLSRLLEKRRLSSLFSARKFFWMLFRRRM